MQAAVEKTVNRPFCCCFYKNQNSSDHEDQIAKTDQPPLCQAKKVI